MRAVADEGDAHVGEPRQRIEHEFEILLARKARDDERERRVAVGAEPFAKRATSIELGTTAIRDATPNARKRSSIACVGTITVSAAFAYERVNCTAAAAVSRRSNGM
jgi:hypothetical protein